MEDSQPISAFSVSPMASRVRLEPGDTYSSYIKVTNPSISTKTLHYKINVTPYNVIGEDYLSDFSNSTAYNKIVDWAEFEKTEGYLEPNNTEVIYYTIRVPEDATSGGQYCSIAVQNVPDETSSSGVGVSDVMEMASIVYSQVGDVIYDGEIISNTVPTFSFSNIVTTSALVENTGNVHQDVQVLIKAYSAFNGEQIMLDLTDEEKESLELGEEISDSSLGTQYHSEIVMPETTKYVTQEVTDLPIVGVFDVSQEVIFNGETSTLNQKLIICPIWLIVIMIAVLGAIIAGICVGVSKHKKAKKAKRLGN